MSTRTLSGLAVLVLGICAVGFGKRKFQSTALSRQWMFARIGVLVVGVALGIAALAHSTYPNPDTRLLGFPFFAAEFQRAPGGGRVDFVGALTVIATVGNFAFGFLIPQILFAGILWLRRESKEQPAAAVTG